ncbi:MAG: hypothetical protein GWN94_18710 [Phycisphaerae bacterium]|nr:hypothetical protein [Phycisphaerae bacterium]
MNGNDKYIGELEDREQIAQDEIKSLESELAKYRQCCQEQAQLIRELEYKLAQAEFTAGKMEGAAEAFHEKIGELEKTILENERTIAKLHAALMEQAEAE